MDGKIRLDRKFYKTIAENYLIGIKVRLKISLAYKKRGRRATLPYL